MPPGGGKDAGFRENELKVVFLLVPEKKPKMAHLSRAKLLMMVVSLFVTWLQDISSPRTRSL